MLANGYILIIALALVAVGFISTIATSYKPNGIAHNFSLIVMVSGAMMTVGILIFSVFSAFIYLVRGL